MKSNEKYTNSISRFHGSNHWIPQYDSLSWWRWEVVLIRAVIGVQQNFLSLSPRHCTYPNPELYLSERKKPVESCPCALAACAPSLSAWFSLFRWICTLQRNCCWETPSFHYLYYDLWCTGHGAVNIERGVAQIEHCIEERKEWHVTQQPPSKVLNSWSDFLVLNFSEG